MRITSKIHLINIDLNTINRIKSKEAKFINVIVVFGEKITLINTGGKGSDKIIFNYIINQGRNLSDIDTVILLNLQPDYCGAVTEIKSNTHCKVICYCQNMNNQNSNSLISKFTSDNGVCNVIDCKIKPDVLLIINCMFQEIKIQDDITIWLIKNYDKSKYMLNVLFLEDKLLFNEKTQFALSKIMTE